MPSTVSFTMQDSGGNPVAGCGDLQRRQHGGDVHADELAGGEAPPTPRRCRGRRTAQRHADDQPVLVELHHRPAPQCPCSIWQNGDTDGCGGRDRHQRGEPGRAVPGEQPAGSSPVSGSTRRPTTPARTSAACGRSTGRCWRAARSAVSPPSGWQELDFSTPVAITAGTTYVVSYHTDAGHYALTAERAGVGGDQRAADRAGRRRRLRLRLGERLPVAAPSTRRTTGSTWCTRSRRAARRRR